MYNLYNEIMKKYPPIHSLEEERRLITVERHNEAKCRELLVLHNIGLARTMGVQFSQICGGYEDAVQIAMIGLIRASEKFDLDKNIKFSTYASYSILGVLGNQEVNRGQLMNNILSMSMNRPVSARNSSTKDKDTAELSNFIEKVIDTKYKEETRPDYNPQKEVEKSDSIRYIEKLINDRKCDNRDKNIVKSYIGITEGEDIEGEVTFKLLGIKYGVSDRRIGQILNEFYDYLRRQLQKVPDYKLAIEGRIKDAPYARKHVHYSKPSWESRRYARIMDEGIKDVRIKVPINKNLTQHVVISGWSNFYSSKYQDTMKALTKNAVITSLCKGNVSCNLSLQTALQRRKAMITREGLVSTETTTKVTGGTFTFTPSGEELPKDMEPAEIVQNSQMDSEEAFRVVEDAIVEQTEISDKGFGIGALEDDGDLDYEVESA